LPRDGADPIASAAAALKDAAKKHSVPTDNVGIAVDTGKAAFRTMKVPFSDREKIEEVLKFEVESLLPQWNIDDVVVDFHVLDSTDEASEILVMAVPKDDLRRDLAVCSKAGIEPLEAELETSAMVDAALQAKVCTVDSAQILVHIGEQSTSVVVMDGARVREMRAIHIGALSHELAPLVEEAPAEEGAEPAPPAPDARDPLEAARRTDQANKRIRRELGRTVAAARTAHKIDGVYVCGLEIPGLVGSVIGDVSVRVLDVFEKDGGGPAQGFGPLVVPYGIAVRNLGGGVLRPSLRREELRYTGAFERIELPLAICALILTCMVCVWGIILKKERMVVDDKLAYWRDSTRNFLVGDPKRGKRPTLEYPSKQIDGYLKDLNADVERNRYEHMKEIQRMIGADILKVKKELGQDTEIKQPQSALRGMELVLGVIEKQMSQGMRPSIRKIHATYQPAKSNRTELVHITMDMAFLAEDSVAGSTHYDGLKNALKTMPGFVDLDEKASNSLDGGKGVSVVGMAVDIDISKLPKGGTP
jgi:hypothetical protein